MSKVIPTLRILAPLAMTMALALTGCPPTQPSQAFTEEEERLRLAARLGEPAENIRFAYSDHATAVNRNWEIVDETTGQTVATVRTENSVLVVYHALRPAGELSVGPKRQALGQKDMAKLGPPIATFVKSYWGRADDPQMPDVRITLVPPGDVHEWCGNPIMRLTAHVITTDSDLPTAAHFWINKRTGGCLHVDASFAPSLPTQAQ